MLKEKVVFWALHFIELLKECFVLHRKSVLGKTHKYFCWFKIWIFALERLGLPGTMSSLSRELVFLILQFLDEEKFKETVHK